MESGRCVDISMPGEGLVREPMILPRIASLTIANLRPWPTGVVLPKRVRLVERVECLYGT
jgi:hypothetical protein